MSQKNMVTQAEYASMRGVSKSYITKLKADDRLVLAADGRVMVEETDARIAETADPNRADVAARHAANRAAEKSTPPQPAQGEGGLQHFKRMDIAFRALDRKLEYEEKSGKLISRDNVLKVMHDSLSTINSALDNMATRLPSLVVGVPDIDTVRARVMEEIEQYRLTVSRQFRDLAERARQAGE